MSNTLTLARDRANAFARLHLQECAAELMSWKETSLLPTDGRIRELAKLCAEFTGPVASLGVAEATVYSVALQALTGPQSEVRRFSIDTDGNGAFAEVVLAEDYEHAVLARQSAEVGVWGATEQKVHLSPAISSQRHNPGPSSPSLLDSVLNYGDRVGSWVENPRGGCYEIPKTTADSWCDSAVIHRMGRERERPFNRANRRYARQG